MRRLEADLYVATDYRVVHEEPSFFVIDKPSPLPVYPVGSFKEKSLLSFLKRDFPLDDFLSIVNRLDSETSGLLIVARSREAARKIAGQFESRTVLKEYLALVSGVPAEKSGRISIPLGWTMGNDFRYRSRDDEAGETAVTDYEQIKEWKSHSLLRLKPFTGRTHQLRIHLALLGHPLVGDKLYIDPAVFEKYIEGGWDDTMYGTVKAFRLALHASRLGFLHPETRDALEFNSESPEIFSDASVEQLETQGWIPRTK